MYDGVSQIQVSGRKRLYGLCTRGRCWLLAFPAMTVKCGGHNADTLGEYLVNFSSLWFWSLNNLRASS